MNLNSIINFLILINGLIEKWNLYCIIINSLCKLFANTILYNSFNILFYSHVM